ncbi:MAG: helix-turn-helix transcriptional regulator [Hydrogenophaga sp.]|jgi:DNA-binding CsgD family transcriptional regulator|uniref:helix-turn-helix transcriptional regulator n=1 Tax=Hydrogenophaga sp. TaxID=1904254 RepID=UPI00271EDADB|nr:helix-turn-helix transcriptional regulator [Hydrogenophaga sp.]MDO9481377.1 helix-turn-helix transcriptional regulator [Hydrogenophaga sp.]MDO9568266.1 helix-turn-helix transcriptional regulator [Hydrogenophaga sp.]MDP1893219.1 helix-turn-helix transcriptional regulator [Hydrogenophaga sp.]MDP2095538.1 helix-turn-helix transcriptional regulator [Hydrogenophaga sp.]MDP2220572.1 helix-turn-helix transcriptional regulator [Hydrogenophaga sp.]
MTLPVNFDSVDVDAVLAEWVSALSDQGVESVLVLGPNPLGGADDREVLAVHPPRLLGPARALAESHDFGASWRESDAPLVAWQDIAKSALEPSGRWRRLWLAHGYQTLVRVAFTLPAGRAFECFLFSPRRFSGRAEAATLAWSAFNIWPLLRRAIAEERVSLSPREQESLHLTFEGLTARETALRMHCSERTVNYHLANAMTKLQTDNKLAAVQRACWIGLI